VTNLNPPLAHPHLSFLPSCSYGTEKFHSRKQVGPLPFTGHARVEAGCLQATHPGLLGRNRVIYNMKDGWEALLFHVSNLPLRCTADQLCLSLGEDRVIEFHIW
jgi:hypothetical protein